MDAPKLCKSTPAAAAAVQTYHSLSGHWVRRLRNLKASRWHSVICHTNAGASRQPPAHSSCYWHILSHGAAPLTIDWSRASLPVRKWRKLIITDYCDTFQWEVARLRRGWLLLNSVPMRHQLPSSVFNVHPLTLTLTLGLSESLWYYYHIMILRAPRKKGCNFQVLHQKNKILTEWVWINNRMLIQYWRWSCNSNQG